MNAKLALSPSLLAWHGAHVSQRGFERASNDGGVGEQVDAVVNGVGWRRSRAPRNEFQSPLRNFWQAVL